MFRVSSKIRIVAFFLVAAALSGCATSQTGFHPSKMSRLNPGLSKTEVLAILGPPSQCATKIEARMLPGKVEEFQCEVFQYALGKPWRSSKSTVEHYLVFFRDGKLIDYGPRIGAMRERVVGTFLEAEPEPAEPSETSN